MGRKIGAVTIGQAPRDDVVPAICHLLGPAVAVRERGALDDLDRGTLGEQALAGRSPILVTRLRDGSEVKVTEEFILPRVQACLDQLQPEVELILLLCTGPFPRLRSGRPLLYPRQVLQNVVRAVLPGRRLGVLTPAPEQVAFQQQDWATVVPEVVVAAASPYGPGAALQAAAEGLRVADVDLIALDCIGYTAAMKELVQATTGRPTLTAGATLAHVAASLL